MEKAIRNAYQLAGQLHDVEVEARIKGPIVRADTAKRLLRKLGMVDGVEYDEQRNKATSGAQTVVYRCINGEDIVCKSKIKSFKMYNEWATIVVSTEVDLYTNEMLAERHFVRTTKTRYSKKLYDGAFRLDVTHLHDDDTFQVEVEVLQYGAWGDFAQCIREIVGVLQDSPLYISRKKFDAVRCIVGGEGYFVSSCVNLNKKGSIAVDCSTNFSMYHGKYQKPITLTRRRLPIIFREKVYMTPKLDGVRRFIVTFNGMTYDIDPEHMHARLLSNDSPYVDPFPSIVDAELVDGMYNVFDICAFKGWYIGDEVLLSRLKYAKSWMDSSHLDNCVMKEYEEVLDDDPVEQINAFFQRHRSGPFPIDGIVFTRSKQTYVESVIKWKEHVTIDLAMDGDGTLEERIVANSIDTDLIPKKSDGTLQDGTGVYEFEVVGRVEDEDTSKFDLRVLRFRDDKKKPNSSNVIMNNIDGMELQGIWEGHTCILMRQYHNAVKREMLGKFAKGSTILDVGSGQGGDVTKWRNANKVYCVEPSDNAMKELKRRLTEVGMKKKVNVIHCPLSDVEKVHKRVERVDVLTLFFTINLFSQQDLDALHEIVDKYQPRHIIGTFLDRSLVRFGANSCYEIVPNGSGYHIHLFGTRINQDEHFFGMDQLHFKGYKLVDLRTLNDSRVMSSNERELSAMFRLFHYRR
ncbi:hypothetical protein BGZ90_008252 [Linnemannia elongata]|nr:hypothetical protein BGZ90_008252 [Linnemannia elongata]